MASDQEEGLRHAGWFKLNKLVLQDAPLGAQDIEE